MCKYRGGRPSQGLQSGREDGDCIVTHTPSCELEPLSSRLRSRPCHPGSRLHPCHRQASTSCPRSPCMSILSSWTPAQEARLLWAARLLPRQRALWIASGLDAEPRLGHLQDAMGFHPRGGRWPVVRAPSEFLPLTLLVGFQLHSHKSAGRNRSLELRLNPVLPVVSALLKI